MIVRLVLRIFLLPSLADGDGIDYSPYLEKIVRGWLCKICAKEGKNRRDMINHVDSRHISVDYICPICQYVNKTNAARSMHILKVHKRSNPRTAEVAMVLSDEEGYQGY